MIHSLCQNFFFSQYFFHKNSGGRNHYLKHAWAREGGRIWGLIEWGGLTQFSWVGNYNYQWRHSKLLLEVYIIRKSFLLLQVSGPLMVHGFSNGSGSQVMVSMPKVTFFIKTLIPAVIASCRFFSTAIDQYSLSRCTKEHTLAGILLVVYWRVQNADNMQMT